MFNPPSSVSTNEGISGSIYNILSNDNIKPNGIDQRYPEQNQLFSAAGKWLSLAKTTYF